MPPRFQPRASWNANLSIINTLRPIKTTNGALKFPGLQDNPAMLLGRTMYENSNMDGMFRRGRTANNYLLLYGAFENFVGRSFGQHTRAGAAPRYGPPLNTHCTTLDGPAVARISTKRD